MQRIYTSDGETEFYVTRFLCVADIRQAAQDATVHCIVSFEKENITCLLREHHSFTKCTSRALVQENMQRCVSEGSTSSLGDGISLGVERFYFRVCQDHFQNTADSYGIANIARWAVPHFVQYKMKERKKPYSKVLNNIMYINNSSLQLKDGITEHRDGINNTKEYNQSHLKAHLLLICSFKR